MLHLISSFWLPLPFLTIRGVDRGEEKAELWFLIVLHSLENALLLLVSRWGYGSNTLGNFLIQLMVIIVSVLMSLSTIVGSTKGLKSRHSFALLCLPAAIILAVFASQAFSDNLPIGIVLFDCVLVILNLFGVLLSVFYVNKVELYAGLPQDLSSLPSFGPEVSFYSVDPSILFRHKHSICSIFRTYPPATKVSTTTRGGELTKRGSM